MGKKVTITLKEAKIRIGSTNFLKLEKEQEEEWKIYQKEKKAEKVGAYKIKKIK